MIDGNGKDEVGAMFTMTTGPAPDRKPDASHWANSPAETRADGPAEGEPSTVYKIPCVRCKQTVAYLRVWAEPGTPIYVGEFALPLAQHEKCPLVIVGGFDG